MRKIGSLRLFGELFLAPMADYTNVAFRTLSKEYGAALVYTELTSAKALTMKSKKTVEMLKVSQREKPVFLQLFGSKPSDFTKALAMVEKKYPDNFAGYDLNCGCSVPKASKGEYGCLLMEEPKNVEQIICAIKEQSNGKPVTAKIRLGLKKENFLEVAAAAEGAGADAIALHPRFGAEGYFGEAKWGKIKELKENISVPLIGNGDIKNPFDVLRMKKETGCDFEMIGRAVMGNAFFFKQATALLEEQKAPERTKEIAFMEGERFLALADEFGLKPNDLRPYFIAFAKGFFGAAQVRNEFGASKTAAEMKKILLAHFGR